MSKFDPARVPREGPWLALFMRGGFALLAQILVAVGFRLCGSRNSWRTAAAYWMVHSSLADLGCLAVLRWLLQKEGVTLGDMLQFDRERLPQDLKSGLIDTAALAAGAWVSSAIQRPFYSVGLPPQVSVVQVPGWALAYGVLAWPPLWVTTEEMVYLGYVLPRLEVQLGSTSLAATLVMVGWGPVQHPTLPALPDRRYIASRSLTTLPIVGSQTVLYLRNGRRLPPLIFGHWVADLVTGLTVLFQPREKQSAAVKGTR